VFSVRDACVATFPFVKPLLKLQDSNLFKHLPNQVAYSLTVVVPSILFKFHGIKFRRSSSLRWTPQALSPATFFPITVAQLVFVHSTIHCSIFSPDTSNLECFRGLPECTVNLALKLHPSYSPHLSISR
jgi:hypothetical protein